MLTDIGGRVSSGFLILVAAAGVCAPGCERRPPPGAPAVMRVGIGAPPVGTRGTGSEAIINIFKSDPWLTYQPDGRPSERLVTSWLWDDEGLALRLKLHPSVYFHDGTPLTADVAAQALRASVAASETTSLNPESVASVDAVGTDTVVIHLRQPNNFVLSDLASVPVTKPGSADIGTGPFQIVRRNGKDATLAAFARYYRGKPALGGVEVTSYPTQRNAWTALMRGDIDMLYEVSRDAAEFVKAESGINTYSFPRPYHISLVFNVRKAVLKDARVRRAINEALDRETLVRDGLNGRGSVAESPIWPQHWAYRTPDKPLVFNPDSARQKLDAAGLRVRAGASGTVGSRFSFDCLVFADDPRFERIAVLVQKQLADVGIEMRLIPLPLDKMGERLAKGDFDAFIIEMAGRSLNWVYDFWRSRPGMRVDTGYRSIDAVLDRIKAAGTDEALRSAVAELTAILRDDPPAAFLLWQQQSRAVSAKFDVSPEKDRDILTNLWLWRPVAASQR